MAWYVSVVSDVSLVKCHVAYTRAFGAGPHDLSRRARARWACVSSSPSGEEETQAQRARARRDNRMTADRGPKYTFYTYVYLFLYFAISWIRRAARTKSAPGSPAKLHHSVHCACGGASWGSDLARGARLIQRDAR